ncbi:Arm DNA-binding domain-containing protein [Magnetovirga frankeli]|uniref:Arm DNA-binding domain-containing protein n=1 Tax=Magnetovirga frankeli TaxID=947516 RepID=UPI003D34E0CA
MKLTAQQVKNAKPAEKAYKLADGEGLFLHVMPNGSRLWRLKPGEAAGAGQVPGGISG